MAAWDAWEISQGLPKTEKWGCEVTLKAQEKEEEERKEERKKEMERKKEKKAEEERGKQRPGPNLCSCIANDS